MSTITYPTNAELLLIAQDKLPRLTKDRPIFDLFPIRNSNDYRVVWDQMDNYKGLAAVRGLNGDPPRVNRVGAKRYSADPFVFGEFERVDEQEMTRRAQYGTWANPVALDDLVAQAQDHLMQRSLDRIELIGWTLVTTGTFSVISVNGAVVASDTYTIQTFSAGVPWSTVATAVPLQNFRAVQLLSRGHSVNFGANATVYMNRVTFNYLVANTNAADLYGKRTAGLATVLGLKDINLVLANEDLPQIQIYDEGYLDDSGTFVPYIANSKAVVVGQRPGSQKLGEFRMTRNANNPNFAPGFYNKVVDEGEDGVPRAIDVHLGFNGHPVIYFPSSVVVMSV
jgi:hypothetical protein